MQPWRIDSDTKDYRQVPPRVMASLDSPRVQYRLCNAVLRILWILTAGASLAVGFWCSRRLALIPLMTGLSLVLLVMWRRDLIARRMEQRRKPCKIKGAVEEENPSAVDSIPDKEPSCR
jgi:hypothetical protein